MQDKEVLAQVKAGFGRRYIGVGAMFFLGFVLVYTALAQPPALGWAVFLIVLGGAALYTGSRMWQATALIVELTEDGLRDSAGTILARIDDIEALDRGVFAFKPSNGFLITTKSRQSRLWRPGLYWRTGRRIGIGGVTPGAETKFMSEMIQGLMAKRDGLI